MTENVKLESISETLARSGRQWHAANYFIATDELLIPPATMIRPDYYALFICMEGSISGTVNGSPLNLLPFCLTATTPSTIIQFNRVSPDCKGRFLLFTRKFLLGNHINSSLVEAFHYLSEQVGFSVQLDAEQADVLLQLYDILLKKRTDDTSLYHTEIIRTLFFTFLYEAATIYKRKGFNHRLHTNRNVELHRQFSELLSVHDRAQHHLKFYADALFITPSHLIHAIKTACGRTPGALIDEALIAEAKLLLANPALTLTQVAAELRFSDMAAFSKFFKKHTGVSPSVYRIDS